MLVQFYERRVGLVLERNEMENENNRSVIFATHARNFKIDIVAKCSGCGRKKSKFMLKLIMEMPKQQQLVLDQMEEENYESFDSEENVAKKTLINCLVDAK